MSNRTPTELCLAPVLNTAASGCELAHRVHRMLDRGASVSLDFRRVEYLTPSFANAFVMTLLEEAGEGALKNVYRVNASDRLLRKLDRAEQRYRDGVRLSTQRPSAA